MVPLIPREVLFGNPERTSPRLSPGGGSLAFLAPYEGVMNLWVRDMRTGAERAITRDAGRGVQDFAWAEDRTHLLYVQDRNGDENWRIYAVKDGPEAPRDLTPRDGVQARLVAVEPGTPHEVLVALNERDPALHDVFRVDLRTGERALVARNDIGAIAWHADHALRVRLAEVQDPAGGVRVFHRRDEADPWREALAWEQEDSFGTETLGFAGDDETVYLKSNIGADTSGLVAWRPADGTWEELARDPQADLSWALFHPATRRAEAAAFTRERLRWHCFDRAVEADLAALAALRDADWDPVSRTRDDRAWVVKCAADRLPAAWYLLEGTPRRARFLFSARPALEPYTLAEMRPIRFAARDGLTIHGYLTLPPEAAVRGLPVVLNVHGGPWARNSWGYDAEAQWLANRGYACLQVNFRGSTGYGKRFLNAANRDWGGAMQDDLTDAVTWLVGQGIADPARVAIYGGSYGGYAVLRGMTTTPELFACGVDVVGPSNLVTFLESIPPYWEPMRALLDRHVGNPARDAAALHERSPLHHVDRIRSPLLIAQGARDPRVKREESLQIVEALRAAGKDVRYLEFADEGHGFVRPQNRLRFFAETERFLAEHLGGRVEDLIRMQRAHNFNAGPAALPLPVLERAREELLDLAGSGMSILEVSHRSKEFEAIRDRAEEGVRRVLGIPDGYEVLFLQGGASLQFAMVPLNLMLEGRPADVLHTGYWTKKAMDDLARVHAVRVAASGEAARFLRLPSREEIAFDPRACYVHMASNNTIEGTQWRSFPDPGDVPLVADMSSDILSRPVDVASFSLIFAGAQKNLGPSGLTLVVVRKDLLARGRETLPAMLRYAVHAKERSLYNTPPTFGVYLLGLVVDWVEAQGGLDALARANEQKAALLYEELERNPLFECPVAAGDRSRMNVVFLPRRWEGASPEAVAAREKRFLQAAERERMVGLKGHRSVGGFRASLYNAVTRESVERLVELLQTFAADEARLA